jgi:adenylate cyclase, class 2
MSAVSSHEIEIKLPVSDLQGIVRRLKEMRAVRGRRVHEVNAVFDTPEGRLRARGQLLRLRVEQRPGGKSPSSSKKTQRLRVVETTLFPTGAVRKAILTMKAPVAGATIARLSGREGPGGSGSGYKVRREIEFSVPDAGALRAVLDYLGLQPVFYYEKYRTTYRLPALKDVIVALDETPIGTYAELEGRPRAIDRARRLLGYPAGDAILASYGALHAARQRSRGLPFGHMLFE